MMPTQAKIGAENWDRLSCSFSKCSSRLLELLPCKAAAQSQGLLCRKDKFSDLTVGAFRVKLFRDRVMEVCRDGCWRWLSKLVSGGREESTSQAGGRCSSGWFVLLVQLFVVVVEACQVLGHLTNILVLVQRPVCPTKPQPPH